MDNRTLCNFRKIYQRIFDAPSTTLKQIGRSNKFIYTYMQLFEHKQYWQAKIETNFFKILFYRASKKATKQKAWKERTEAPIEKCASKTK